MAIVTTKANEILNELLNPKYYIGLTTSAPNQNGSNVTEPAASTGYKRMPLSAMGSASNAQISNTDIIFFPESLASWGTITHFVVYTSQNASTPIYYGELTEAVSIPQGYVPIFRAGALKVALDRDVS